MKTLKQLKFKFSNSNKSLSFGIHDKVDIRVARIFNTFGPRMHPNDGRVVSNFIIQGLQGSIIMCCHDSEF